jgi:hypothetical protein
MVKQNTGDATMLRLHISQNKEYGLDPSSLDASKGVPCWDVVQTTRKDFTQGVKTFYNQAEAEAWVEAVHRYYAEGNLKLLHKMLNKKTRR